MTAQDWVQSRDSPNGAMFVDSGASRVEVTVPKRPRGIGLGVPFGAASKPTDRELPGPLERLQLGLSLRQSNIPAIISEKEAAQILGVNPDIMREFRRLGLVEPLGDYGDQVPKRYASVGIVRLMSDEDRLRAMDAAQTKYWKGKNAARSVAGGGHSSRAEEQASGAAA